MTDSPAAQLDFQQLTLRHEQFTQDAGTAESDVPAPVNLACVLITSGYVDLGAAILRDLCSDAAWQLEDAALRHRLLVRLVYEAHRTPIRRDIAQSPGTDAGLTITAYALHTDRTGSQLQRIADFLQETELHALAALVRAQPPTPYPRRIDPPPAPAQSGTDR